VETVARRGWIRVSCEPMTDPVAREFLLAFWKLHILHHAGDGGVYGQWMLEELAEHGYRLSPGTLYPMLARMERHGWLRSNAPARATAARRYTLTAAGRATLARLRDALDELYDEVGKTQKAKGKRQKA
jgi:PadR family transcriptional regulator, regulatory protein PadR